MMTVVLIGVLIVVVAALADIYKFWVYSDRLHSTPASGIEIEEAFVLLKRATRAGHLLRAQINSGAISAADDEDFQLYMLQWKGSSRGSLMVPPLISAASKGTFPLLISTNYAF
jgi:hypothetical protein